MPPRPISRSLPPSPQITSRPVVPRSRSFPFVPTIVQLPETGTVTDAVLFAMFRSAVELEAEAPFVTGLDAIGVVTTVTDWESPLASDGNVHDGVTATVQFPTLLAAIDPRFRPMARGR